MFACVVLTRTHARVSGTTWPSAIALRHGCCNSHHRGKDRRHAETARIPQSLLGRKSFGWKLTNRAAIFSTKLVVAARTQRVSGVADPHSLLVSHHQCLSIDVQFRVSPDRPSSAQTWNMKCLATLVVGAVASVADVASPPQSHGPPGDWRCAQARLRYGTTPM